MPTLTPAKLARLDARLSQWVEEGAYAGMEWMIGGVDGLLHAGRAGARDPSGAPMPDAPLYRIYSMTKPIVTLAALQMVEECRLSLHTPLGDVLWGFREMEVLEADGTRRPAARQATMLDLMRHTAGFSYGFLSDPVAPLYAEARLFDDATASLQDEIDRLAALPLANDPGAAWRYSVATDVLAAAMEMVEDRPIQDILRDRVIGPLGMAETGFRIPPGTEGRLMALCTGGVGGRPLKTHDMSARYPHDSATFGRGGMGLFSTMRDYARLCRALLEVSCGAGPRPGLPGRKTLEMATANLVDPALLPLRLELPAASDGPGMGGLGFGLGFRAALPHAGGAAERRFLASPGEYGWSGAAETWFTVIPQEGLWGLFMAQNFDWPGAHADFQTLMTAAIE